MLLVETMMGYPQFTDDFPVESMQRNTPAQIPIENETMLSAEMVDPDENRRMLREELRNVLAEERTRTRTGCQLASNRVSHYGGTCSAFHDCSTTNSHNVDDRRRKRC